MISIDRKLDIRPVYDFDLLAPKERIVFFDIETTGLKASTAALYLIGAVTYEDGSWCLKQFFAESPADEEALLRAFFDLLGEKKKNGRVVLVSYNGDGFDIPFLQNCIRQYSLGYSFSGMISMDLLKKVRPYKALSGLCDCRLKTVEQFCGIRREDRYNGGELIYVYEEYLRMNAMVPGSLEDTPLNAKLKAHLMDTLLLHNAEDIADMPMIMQVLGYDSLFTGGFDITESVVEDGVWDIHARLHCPLPKGIYRETPEYTLSVSEEDPEELNLAVPLYEGELKYFFVDYKNYYYLPAEDCAVHKSVGEFVDRKARKQATARTCYQKKQGRFVPQPSPVFTPLFYREYKGTPYGELTFADRGGEEETRKYVCSLLQTLK
jgi:uncharacterized protein YprB with RNaseH-like and TPR domain